MKKKSQKEVGLAGQTVTQRGVGGGEGAFGRISRPGGGGVEGGGGIPDAKERGKGGDGLVVGVEGGDESKGVSGGENEEGVDGGEVDTGGGNEISGPAGGGNFLLAAGEVDVEGAEGGGDVEALGWEDGEGTGNAVIVGAGGDFGWELGD